jgi:hypothetical protein
MRESILFFAWQDAEKVPEMCPLCKEDDAVFEYRISPGEGAVDAGRELKGYCCLICAQQLLATLHELILVRWASEDPNPPEFH